MKYSTKCLDPKNEKGFLSYLQNAFWSHLNKYLPHIYAFNE